MSEKKKSIPKPTLNKPTPQAPPTTTFDDGPPAAPPTEKPVAVEEEAQTSPAQEAAQSAPAETPNSEGVETDLVKRFLGAFIDGLVAGLAGYLAALITDVSSLQWIVAGLVLLVRDSLPFLDGQSPGKKAMKTKAVKEDGSSLSGDWVTGATRNILLAIPFAWLVECYILITRSSRPGDGLRLGDNWAGTKVISVD